MGLDLQDMLLILLKQLFGVFLILIIIKKAVLKSVNLGDDTDTVAALIGGLAGLFYGFESVPKKWIGCIAIRAKLKK